ncbi:hypothetical protein [Streptomyces sp. BPTC-684]|uniref:hypothetical protein n=1 Tax=Streptomyces sp. BPTC-684 TaxID=3043734 RepID=UPI0024B26E96|nr:hypothetical protein [Streptomyces sp. BPTC-684]WHM40895.1 hypothetical protein QIY60_31120 [Streptomyces sp. BPTC-684]
MRRTTVRRTALAASTLSLALLVSGCGSEGSAAKEESKGKTSSGAPTAPATTSAQNVLSQAELDKLVLAEADLKDHKVAKPTQADLASSKTVTTDKAACKPLGDVMALRAPGSPGASATRKVMAVPKGPGASASAEEKAKAGLDALGSTITADTLASYSGRGAADALAALKKAGADCAGGFSLIAEGDKTAFKVSPASYTAGDEAVAFTLTADLDGEPGTSHLVAIRQGTTLATFYAFSLAGKAEQPKAVIDAQLKKLA